MVLDMVGKLAPISPHFTRGLVKCVPGRGYFRAVPSQNGDRFATSPTPPIVERLWLHFPSGRGGQASLSHERRRTETIQHVRQRTPVRSLWPRKNMPSPCDHYRRGRPPSTANTPTSGITSATSRPSGALTPRRWRQLNVATRRSPLTSGQAPDSHFPPAPRRAPRPRLPP